ncbi:AEC family transporter [Thermovibrio sp.]
MGELLINVILPLYLLIASGYLMGKLKPELETKSISFMVLYLFAPALIFYSFKKVEITPQKAGIVAFVGLTVFLTSYALSLLAEAMLLKERDKAFELSSTVMNAGYLGIPLIYLTFGQEGLPYAITFMVIMAVYHFTLGILILKGREVKEGVKSALKLPLIYAAGLALALKGLELPPGIEKTLKLTGDATMPLMLVSIGISLSKIELKEFKKALIATLVRFIGGTLGALLALTFLKAPTLLKKVLIVQSSLPSAVLNFVLCEEFGSSPQTAASVIFLSTLLFPIYFVFLSKLLSFL